MQMFLILNDHDIEATVDDQEQVMPKVASGEMDRATLAEWLRDHVIKIE